MTTGAGKALRRCWESDPGLSVFVLPPLFEPERSGRSLVVDLGFFVLACRPGPRSIELIRSRNATVVPGGLNE